MGEIAKLQTDIADVNRAKGWYGRDVSFGELLALIHSEVSEALEAFRVSDSDTIIRHNVGMELADVVIRTLDTAERQGIDLEPFIYEKLEINKLRPYRHGGKKL